MQHLLRQLRHSSRWRAMMIHTTPQSGGMFDSVRSKMNDMRQETEEQKEQKAFEAQMKYLSDDKRPIDGNIYLETIEDIKEASGLSGFREHLPWVSNNPTLAELKREKLILNTLTEDGRKNVARVKISEKKRVARVVETDLLQVEALLDRVAIMHDVQRWVLKLQMEDKQVPSSSAELQRMISTPGSGFKRSRTFKKRLFPSPGVKPNKTGKRW